MRIGENTIEKIFWVQYEGHHISALSGAASSRSKSLIANMASKPYLIFIPFKLHPFFVFKKFSKNQPFFIIFI